EKLLRTKPSHPLSAARADLLLAMRAHQLAPGRQMVLHRFRNACVVANAFRQELPLTVHPGIGYDIISNHPMFNGAVIGRAADIDFRLFGASVEKLDGGVVLSIGSAIMGPQVFEKSLSCVNNLRLQTGRPIVSGHTIYVLDLRKSPTVALISASRSSVISVSTVIWKSTLPIAKSPSKPACPCTMLSMSVHSPEAQERS